jgi:hypothetical protein
MKQLVYGALSFFMMTLPLYAVDIPIGKDPRMAEFDREHARGNYRYAEAIMRRLYEDYPNDPTPKIEISMLILQETNAPRLCDAVALLEESLGQGEAFFSKKLLDTIYGGHWAAFATLEGSRIASLYLRREIASRRWSWEEIGVERGTGLSHERVRAIGRHPILCRRQD